MSLARHTQYPHRGHAHFWRRATMTRRQLIMSAAASTGAVLGAPLWLPTVAHARPRIGSSPRPIPGGLQFFGPGTELYHVFPPGPNVENSTITDFKGAIASAHILGTATQIQGVKRTSGLLVDGDVRFMQGIHIGVDGERHHGTFGFF
jgi:hypothetical protein